MIQRFKSGGAVLMIGAALVVVIALAVFGEHQVGSLKTQGLVVTTEVLPGQVITAKDISRVNITLGGQPIHLLASIPTGSIASVALSPGTLIQASDLASKSLAEVEIAVQHTPLVVAGDTIDIYLNNTGAALTSSPSSTTSSSGTTVAPNGVVLIGVGIPVTAVSGTGLTILVPFDDATSWAAISASAPQLVAVTATTSAAPSTAQTNLNNALSVLETRAGQASPGK